MNNTYNINVSYQYIATIQSRISINYWRITEFLKNIFVTVKRYCITRSVRSIVWPTYRSTVVRPVIDLAQHCVRVTCCAQSMRSAWQLLLLQRRLWSIFVTIVFYCFRLASFALGEVEEILLMAAVCLAIRNCGCYF